MHHALQLPWKRRLRAAWRRLVSRRRVLPDFLIVGGMKCGTTTLLHHLNQHPQIAPAAVKEVHFFDTQFARGADWYRAFFPTQAEIARRTDSQQQCLTGEASPYYLVHPNAPRRIAEVVPQVKLIALLREPSSRAYSHYVHNRRAKHRRAGREPLSFEEAIAREPERIAGEWERMLADPTYESAAYRHYSYAHRGLYLQQLERYGEYFDRGQMLVVNSDDLFRRTQPCYDEVLAFLGLPPRKLNTMRVRNSGKYVDRPDDALRRLREYFAPHNQRLYEYLGRDFHW